jgi:hypothetical protein
MPSSKEKDRILLLRITGGRDSPPGSMAGTKSAKPDPKQKKERQRRAARFSLANEIVGEVRPPPVAIEGLANAQKRGRVFGIFICYFLDGVSAPSCIPRLAPFAHAWRHRKSYGEKKKGETSCAHTSPTPATGT